MSPLGTISSPANDRVKYIKSLKNKRVRHRDKRYFLEGRRLVAEALGVGVKPAFVLYTQSFASAQPGKRLVGQIEEAGVPSWVITPDLVKVVSDTMTPQGVVAVVGMGSPDPEAVRSASLVLVLDNLRDPGNMGTILRTALATGVEAVLLPKGCVDPYSPKVVRAGMGAQLVLPIHVDLEWPRIGQLLVEKRRILTDPHRSVPPWQMDLLGAVALIVGNEAHGASEPARNLAECSVSLPMRNGVESLNAAVATAVVLFEAQRQRSERATLADVR